MSDSYNLHDLELKKQTVKFIWSLNTTIIERQGVSEIRPTNVILIYARTTNLAF